MYEEKHVIVFPHSAAFNYVVLPSLVPCRYTLSVQTVVQCCQKEVAPAGRGLVTHTSLLSAVCLPVAACSSL